jgi:hypothetical protein
VDIQGIYNSLLSILDLFELLDEIPDVFSAIIEPLAAVGWKWVCLFASVQWTQGKKLDLTAYPAKVTLPP